jgi:hypothetical protein
VDFVVVGLGLGTLAILAGVLTLVWVAGRWERAAARATTPEDAAHDRTVAAGRRGAGQALIGAGVAVLIATIGALAGSLDDQTGAFFVTTTATVAALGLLVWAFLYRTRNPLPPRRVQTKDGGRGTEVGRREEALNEPELAVAEALPLVDEPVVDEDAADEVVPSIAPLPAESGNPEPVLAMAEDDEGGDDSTDDLPEQPEPAMNGAKAAPFAHHEHEREREREREDDWEGRSERES